MRLWQQTSKEPTPISSRLHLEGNRKVGESGDYKDAQDDRARIAPADGGIEKQGTPFFRRKVKLATQKQPKMCKPCKPSASSASKTGAGAGAGAGAERDIHSRAAFRPLFFNIQRRQVLALSVVGGVAITAVLWGWNPALISAQLTTLVLCIAVPLSVARGLGAGSHARRVLETAATAPIAAAAINPQVTFQLINAASCGLGFPCQGTCCSSGG